MKSKFIKITISVLITLSMLLSVACSADQGVENDTDHTTQTETGAVTEADTQTDNTEESESESGDASTEQTTEEVLEIIIPDTPAPDITSLIGGESVTQNIGNSFANTSLSAVLGTENYISTGGTLFSASEKGLTANNTGWDALGFASPVSTNEYSARASFYVYENDRGGNNNAALVGLFCPSANNLFIDGGLWFAIRDSQISAYVKDGFDTVIAKRLEFSAADGIEFNAVGVGNNVEIFVNGKKIADVTYSEESLTLTYSDGSKSINASLDNLNTDNGFFRYMSHYANTALVSMSLEGKTETKYTPDSTLYSVCVGEAYGFEDKAQILCDKASVVYSGVCFADATLISKMFDMEYSASGDILTLSRNGIELKFTKNKATVTINGEEHPFPTVVAEGGSFMIAIDYFASMLGYVSANEGDVTVMTSKDAISDSSVSVASERFELYRNVVYNYEDVECDQTGVGRYNKTKPQDRLVGIAYTTWHRPTMPWGEGYTWDTPLYGTYYSNDEAIIRMHGEMLRDAGVDFVFVDWSNNTNYDPLTMADKRDDFRMIEEATDMLFDIWATIEGAPKICIFVGPGHNGVYSVNSGAHQRKVDQVYRDYVNNPDRADMYFYYEGKPLLICYGATPNQYTSNPTNIWNDDRYTVRWMTGYVGQQPQLYNENTLQSNYFWSWEERAAQTYTTVNRRVEAITVCASTRSQGNPGDAGYIPASERDDGATLKKQFQRACDLGAGIVLIVSWNEWTTSEQPTPEISKDIEPSAIYGTFYYDLMREQIKKFKGLV